MSAYLIIMKTITAVFLTFLSFIIGAGILSILLNVIVPLMVRGILFSIFGWLLLPIESIMEWIVSILLIINLILATFASFVMGKFLCDAVLKGYNPKATAITMDIIFLGSIFIHFSYTHETYEGYWPQCVTGFLSVYVLYYRNWSLDQKALG